MKTKIISIVLLFIIPVTIKAQFWEDLKRTFGDITNTTINTITAPTQVLINTGRAITGNGSASDIYRPIQQVISQTGNTTANTINLINQPQQYFYQKAQEFVQQTTGNTGSFLFDVGTFTNRYYSELLQSGANNVNAILQGQNPFQLFGAPLAAAIRAAKQRYGSNTLPIPEEIKNVLRSYFKPGLLDRARYTVGNIEITLPNFIGQGQKFMGNDKFAVTIDNIIVFNTQPGSYNDDGTWWAHELTHVQQYENMGIELFSYNYIKDLGSSIEREAEENSFRITGSYNSDSFSNGYALNVGSFDMSSSSVDQSRNFYSNPEYYVAQCVFPRDQFGYMYLVTNYGRIIAVNPINGQWQHIGYSTPPRLPNVAWSYDLPNSNWSYAVGFDSNIYTPMPVYNSFGQIINQQWVVVGYVVRLQ